MGTAYIVKHGNDREIDLFKATHCKYYPDCGETLKVELNSVEVPTVWVCESCHNRSVRIEQNRIHSRLYSALNYLGIDTQKIEAIEEAVFGTFTEKSGV